MKKKVYMFDFFVKRIFIFSWKLLLNKFKYQINTIVLCSMMMFCHVP
jgi:hypothetical protein